MTHYRLDGTKLAWHRDRVQAWLAGERIAPITVDGALTRRCNYRCVYCYGQLQANDEQRLTRDVIYRFLDDAAAIGVKAVSWVSDGESACSPHLKAALLRGRDNGLDMALATNGALLRHDELDEILPTLTYLRFNCSAGEEHRYREIMGARPQDFERVLATIQRCVAIKRARALDVTLGLQMVLMPQFADQILPVARLGKELGVDYTVIKHCSDDERHSLGVDYAAYPALTGQLEQAEALSTDGYLVRAKWSKILSGGARGYTSCLGPPFILQFSGSGLVAPCGMLFNRRYSAYHIGNLAETSFKELWQSDRYWEVMRAIRSEGFNPQVDCGTLCLQHNVNELLWGLAGGQAALEAPRGDPPAHINFI